MKKPTGMFLLTIVLMVTGLMTSSNLSASIQTGVLSFVDASGTSRLTYVSTEPMRVRLSDADRNLSSSAVDVVSVVVSSATEPQGESLTLTETGTNTGVFVGSLGFSLSSSASSNGLLDVIKGDKVTVSYVDPADDFGNQSTVSAKVYFDVTLLSGALVSHLTKANSPYLITGDVTVPNSVTVNVEPGTEIRFTPLSDDRSSGKDPNRIEIIVNGRFNVNGTASDSVRFVSNADAPSPGDWYGIRYDQFNTSSIQYAVLNHATQLLTYGNVSIISDTIRVKHCRLSESGAGIIIPSYVSNCVFDISDNRYDCGGIFVHKPNNYSDSPSLVSTNNVINSSSSAYSLRYLKDLFIGNNRSKCGDYFVYTDYISGIFSLTNNTVESRGLFVYSSGHSKFDTNYCSDKLTISGNQVFAQSGIQIDHQPDVHIGGNHLYLTNGSELTPSVNQMYENGYGIYLNNVTQASLLDNILDARGFDNNGIHLNQTNATVRGNKVSGFNRGIYVNSSFESPTLDSIQANTIMLNYSRGVQLEGYTKLYLNYNNLYANYDTLSYDYNSSQYYQTYDLYCNTDAYDQVDARYNYWGVTTTTQMAEGSNPKNITRIFEKQDDSSKSFVNYAQWLATPDASVNEQIQTGVLSFVDASGASRLTYVSTEPMRVRLSDADRNLSSSAVDVVSVVVSSATEPQGESLTLTETGTNTGVFVGSLGFSLSSSASSNGLLDVIKGDKVTVSYVDPADDFGNQSTVSAKVYFDVTLLSGALVSHLTKANSPYLITGDVTVPNSVTVNVEPGTEIRFTPLSDDRSSGKDPNRIEIIVNGRFNVNGTASDSVRFVSNADAPSPGDWYGIRYDQFNTSSIQYAVLNHATQLLTYGNVSIISDTIRVKHCRLSESGAGIIIPSYVSNCVFDISDNRYDCGGIFVHKPNNYSDSPSLVSTNNVINSSSSAYSLRYLKDLFIGNNRSKCGDYFVYTDYISGIFSLTNNTVESRGLFVYSSGHSKFDTNYCSDKLTISGNQVFAQSGIQIDHQPDVHIGGNHLYLTNGSELTPSVNQMYENGYGIYLNNVTQASLLDNILDARGFDNNGIHLNQTNATVRGNKVSGFNRGIYVNSSFESPTLDSIQANTIMLNYSRGVQLEGYTKLYLNYNNLYANYDTLSYDYNSSQYYQTYDLYCNTGAYDQVDARYNYWGVTTTTQMTEGSNPKNITRIFEKQDDSSKSFVNYAQWLATPDASVNEQIQTGVLSFVDASGASRLTYVSTEPMRVRLSDADRNLSSSAVDVVSVVVSSATEPQGESLTLTETGTNTGVFVGSLGFSLSSSASSNGLLDVIKGDKVTVSYVDPADDFGNQSTVSAKVYFDVTLLSGALVSHLTKANSPYLITGDVTVPNSVTVNVEPGTEIRFTPLSDDRSSGKDPNRIEIIVNGRFNVNGTASDSVRFVSNADAPSPGDWYGIRYDQFNTSSIQYAVLNHATQLLTYGNVSIISDTIRVKHCRLSESGAGIIIPSYVSNCVFDISDNRYDCGGIFVHKPNNYSDSPSLVSTNNVINSSSSAYSLRYLKDLFIGNNRSKCGDYFVYTDYISGIFSLTNNTVESRGLFVYSSGHSKFDTNYCSDKLTISGNQVFAQSGIQIDHQPDVHIGGNHLYLTNGSELTPSVNQMYENGYGIYLNNVTQASLLDNILDARGFDNNGIHLNQTNATVRGNKVSGFNRGIYVNSSFESPTLDSIQANTIMLNYSRGVQLEGYTKLYLNYNNLYANYDTLSYDYNSSQYYQTYDLYCNTGAYDQVDARYNYWGVTTTTQMTEGSNPKNITRIFEKQDDSSKSFVNYAQWLATPYGIKSVQIIATDTEVCEGVAVELTLFGVTSDNQRFEFTKAAQSNQVEWSTGSTATSLIVTPSTTTSYWVRYQGEYGVLSDTITIIVGEIPAPVGANVQYVPVNSRLRDLSVVGDRIQWYDAPVGGNWLDSLELVVDGATYYASQFRDACEGVDRLVVKAYIDDPFTLPYTGNGTDHMTLYVLDASIDGVLLDQGDVIAVYDDTLCVGKTKLVGPFSTIAPFAFVSASKAESGLLPINGYTEGRPISIRIWDASEQSVYYTTLEFYESASGNQIEPNVFEQGATAFVKVKARSEQEVHLMNGWNIISLNLLPDITDISASFASIINNGTLLKMMDEGGRAIENIGVFGGWVNHIGHFSTQEGYKVKVSKDTSLFIKGKPVKLPYTLTLTAGWNIISYPGISRARVIDVFEPLVSSNVLIKVMDDAGNAYEKIGSVDGWSDNIGELLPGKGYKVKVSTDATLSIEASYPSVMLRAATSPNALYKSTNAVVFQKAYVGNGYDHMNIYLVNTQQLGLMAGDEIGVFDNELCVGSFRVASADLTGTHLSLIASKDDQMGDLPNGFMENHPISLRFARNGVVNDLNFTVEGDGNDYPVFEAGKSIILTLKTPLDLSVAQDDLRRIVCFPNPFKDVLTIALSRVQREGSVVEVRDVAGRLVRRLSVDSEDTTQSLIWDGTNGAGVMVDNGLYIISCNDMKAITVVKK